MGFFHKNETKGPNAGRADVPYVAEGHGQTDEQIRADVHERLMDDTSARHLSVSVQDGVVELGGDVASEAERQRLMSVVAAIPSVRGVENRLCVSPRSQQSRKV
jgi:osmotically-inducible protein OsmY